MCVSDKEETERGKRKEGFRATWAPLALVPSGEVRDHAACLVQSHMLGGNLLAAVVGLSNYLSVDEEARCDVIIDRE